MGILQTKFSRVPADAYRQDASLTCIKRGKKPAYSPALSARERIGIRDGKGVRRYRNSIKIISRDTERPFRKSLFQFNNAAMASVIPQSSRISPAALVGEHGNCVRSSPIFPEPPFLVATSTECGVIARLNSNEPDENLEQMQRT
jgi:hypothetical protein